MIEEEIGEVTHYFGKIGVAIVKLTAGSISIGDTVHIKGRATDFSQTVDSLESEHQKLSEAKAGDSFGTKAKEKVREGDKVFKVVGE